MIAFSDEGFEEGPRLGVFKKVQNRKHLKNAMSRSLLKNISGKSHHETYFIYTGINEVIWWNVAFSDPSGDSKATISGSFLPIVFGNTL